MRIKLWSAWAILVMLLLAAPPTWALDPGANDVNLNNFERPLLGRNQLYFNLNSGLTWHNDHTMFDRDRTFMGNISGVPIRIRDSWEQEIRDRWHQWNAGGELGLGITDKIMTRVWGNANFPAFSEPSANRQFDVHILGLFNINIESDFRNEDLTRWRKSESFGASVAFRPFPNWEFYVTTDGSLSQFREDIYYFSSRGVDSLVALAPAFQKAKVRERNYQQDLLGGFKYLFERPAHDKKIAAMDLRRSPQPKVVDLYQWDRTLLHRGEFMVNPYGGVRFVDQRKTYFDRHLMAEDGLFFNETRNWPIWTRDETVRDAYAQGIVGARAAVGITDSLLLEGGYQYYLPVTYKRFVTRKNGNQISMSLFPFPLGSNYFDEADHGQNEGWAGDAKITFRLNPWVQVFGGYSGQWDHGQFFSDTSFRLLFGMSPGEEKGEMDRRLVEHRVFGGFTFLTPVKGDANPAPTAKRTLSDFQRPLLQPLQFGASIYGGWRYVQDEFIFDLEKKIPFGGTPFIFKERSTTDRSFSQGFVGAEVYLGILQHLQFDASAHYYPPARYGNGSTRRVTSIVPPMGNTESQDQSRRDSGEESAWDVNPRLTFRPWSNFEAFLAGSFGQVRTVRNTDSSRAFVPDLAPLSMLREKRKDEFTKNETLYNVNAGIKVLFP